VRRKEGKSRGSTTDMSAITVESADVNCFHSGIQWNPESSEHDAMHDPDTENVICGIFHRAPLGTDGD